jgi:DNA-binding XRE family transcriptional regulator
MKGETGQRVGVGRAKDVELVYLKLDIQIVMSYSQDMDGKFRLQGVGQRLREMRQNRGLTQLELAHRAGVTRLKVIAIEAGRDSVAAGSYARVAAALGADLQALPMLRPTLDELGRIFNG